ncbi:divergent polysaccharide deacetylase family protein [Idiomarina sp. HP20-50]|uniref:divergent polysaccharide deacetylase family protein n=1 Tax=Idiomarina sp. HP20-50 TaxID=3070813 RepID=UPI00294B3299|nr:divergent polysaccharide deacetylase family protein [Idiomarina sp. HP20-50]MDV6316286.1 divergent polysaccharide deacetylase family protein [Idiomarina sp. HP20-50]
MRRFFATLFLSALLINTAVAAKIAIVIDDIGNHRSDLQAALLPGNISFAVLPYTPYARAFALRAHHQKKQILLHMPMEAVENNHPGPGVVTADMSSAQIKLQLVNALDSIPYVAGVNNHMGSKLTQLPLPMQAVMETLAARELFFIDSRTSEFSVAEHIAGQFGVKVSRRHVFLDNEVNEVYLQQQFDQLLRLAKRNGQAIGIGHPYPETLSFLKKKLPQLKQQGIELVFVSELAAMTELNGSLLQATSAK